MITHHIRSIDRDARIMFTKIALLFIFENVSLLKSPWFSFVKAQHPKTKSDEPSKVSKSTNSAPTSLASFLGLCPLYKNLLTPNGANRRATATPIRPSPTIPINDLFNCATIRILQLSNV